MFLLFKTLVIALVSIMILFADAKSQIIIALAKPPLNQLKSEHLWKLQLNNPTPNTYKVFLTGSVTERTEGTIFEARSSFFELPPGIKNVAMKDLGNISIISSRKDYEEMLIRTGTVKEGDYELCVTAINSVDNAELGQGCIGQPIIQPATIELISPLDGATITEELPVFIFAVILQNDHASLKIVEVMENQTPVSAMETNPKWFEIKNLKMTSFVYPASARKFDKGKKYAWQVSLIRDLKLRKRVILNEVKNLMLQFSVFIRCFASLNMTKSPICVTSVRDGNIISKSEVWGFSPGDPPRVRTFWGQIQDVSPKGCYNVCCNGDITTQKLVFRILHSEPIDLTQSGLSIRRRGTLCGNWDFGAPLSAIIPSWGSLTSIRPGISEFVYNFTRCLCDGDRTVWYQLRIRNSAGDPMLGFPYEGELSIDLTGPRVRLLNPPNGSGVSSTGFTVDISVEDFRHLGPFVSGVSNGFGFIDLQLPDGTLLATYQSDSYYSSHYGDVHPPRVVNRLSWNSATNTFTLTYPPTNWINPLPVTLTQLNFCLTMWDDCGNLIGRTASTDGQTCESHGKPFCWKYSITDIVDTTCDCGNWNPVNVSWLTTTTTVTRGGTIPIGSIPMGTTLTINSSYNCVPPTPTCSPSYTWIIDDGRGTITRGASLPFTLSPATPGNYYVVIAPQCGTLGCDSTWFWITIGSIEPHDSTCRCVSWGPINMEWLSSSTTIVTGTTFNPGIIPSGTSFTINPNFVCAPTTCSLSFSWRVNFEGVSFISPTISPIIFTPTSPGTYTIIITPYCGSIECNAIWFDIEIPEIATTCRCLNWDPINVSWLSTSTTVGAGGIINTGSIPLGTPITINTHYNCSPPSCASTYTWRISGGGTSWSGGTMPFSFTPPATGEYALYLTSGCEAISCDSIKFKIRIANITDACACSGGSNLTIAYDYGSVITQPCGSTLSATSIGSSITINRNLTCNPSPPCTPVHGLAIYKDGATVGFIPGVVLPYSYTFLAAGSYTFVLSGMCGSTRCDTCYFSINVADIISDTCSCRDWRPVRILYGSSATNYNCLPGGAVGSVDIGTLPVGTPINLRFNVNCSPSLCTPTYDWVITGPGGTSGTFTGIEGNISFTPTASTTYDVILNARCNGRVCAPCRFKIYVIIRESPCDEFEISSVEITYPADGTTRSFGWPIGSAIIIRYSEELAMVDVPLRGRFIVDRHPDCEVIETRWDTHRLMGGCVNSGSGTNFEISGYCMSGLGPEGRDFSVKIKKVCSDMTECEKIFNLKVVPMDWGDGSPEK